MTKDEQVSFDLLFNPRNAAIFEAKKNVSFFIEGFKRQGYNLDNLFLISPTGEDLVGLKCFKSFNEIQTDTIDLLILSVRRERLLQSLEDILAQKKINFIHIFTAGTGESDDLGMKIERDLKKFLDNHKNIRIVGPNCMGLYSPRGKIAYYSSFPTEIGNIGLIFQSGDLHSKMVKFGSKLYNLRFSRGISVGNCVDLQIRDFLNDFNNDDDTDIICVYFEGVSTLHENEGKKLLNTLKSMKKPVLFMRGGKTNRAQTAVMTHTGSLGTNKKIWDAIYKQTPIIEVPSCLDDLIDYAYIFHNILNRFKKLKKEVFYPEGKRALVILWSGGFGILATDTLTELGIKMPLFKGEKLERLKKVYPSKIGSLSNPLDMPWITSRKEFLIVSKAAINEDIDLVIIETDSWSDMEGEHFKGYYNNLMKLKEHIEDLNKVFIIILHQYPSVSREKFYKMLINDDFIVYPSLPRAAKSFLAFHEYGKKLRKHKN